MSPEFADDHQASAPFEGPEKLLEIWFAPFAAAVPPLPAATQKKTGLRTVPRETWEEMLDIVKCKVLSVVEGDEVDAYLLSESSFFVSPHRLILKTCGTTLNLLGLPRILEIASQQAGLTAVYRLFYSRKSFMFPERQTGPHRDWKQEVEYLDRIFNNGSAYTIGKVNGDHWLLYMTGAEAFASAAHHHHHHHQVEATKEDRHADYTIEILMSDLSAKARQPFFFGDSAEKDRDADATAAMTPAAQAAELSEQLGITRIFPPELTRLDAYAFDPCGYSSNALIKWGHESLEDTFAHVGEVNGNGDAANGSANGSLNEATLATSGSGAAAALKVLGPHSGEGYYTIHVTPEEGWSYASFECNVPLSTAAVSAADGAHQHDGKIPDLKNLIKRVVNIFEPGRITLTLFISSEDNETGADDSAVEAAQRAFKAALSETPIALDNHAFSSPVVKAYANGNGHANGHANGNGIPNGVSGKTHRAYKRTDKINYEFGGYDLAFASFELK